MTKGEALKALYDEFAKQIDSRAFTSRSPEPEEHIPELFHYTNAKHWSES